METLKNVTTTFPTTSSNWIIVYDHSYFKVLCKQTDSNGKDKFPNSKFHTKGAAVYYANRMSKM